MADTLTNIKILPSYCCARILILGVGNILFGDDGFGPEVVAKLLQDYRIPEDIYIMDVGTGVRKLLFTLTLSEVKPEEIMILDAVDWGDDIGQVSQVPVGGLPVTKVDDFSLHQVPTSNMLRELQDAYKVIVTVVACDVGEIPQVIEPGLSQTVMRAVQDACMYIADRYALRLFC